MVRHKAVSHSTTMILHHRSVHRLTRLPVYDCSDIASDSHITVEQLTAWNPWIGPDCDTGIYANLGDTDFRAVCIGVNSTATNPSPTTSSVVTPSPVQSGIAKDCNTFYKVKSGDGCYDIAKSYGISLDVFYSYNPAVDDDCSKLYPDNYVCVGKE